MRLLIFLLILLSITACSDNHLGSASKLLFSDHDNSDTTDINTDTGTTYLDTDTTDLTSTDDKCLDDSDCDPCYLCNSGVCEPIPDGYGEEMSFCGERQDGTKLCCTSKESCSATSEDEAMCPGDDIEDLVKSFSKDLDDNDIESDKKMRESGAALDIEPVEANIDFDEGSCELENKCEDGVKVKCIPEDFFCRSYPGACGACDGSCRISLPMQTCYSMKIQTELVVYEVCVATTLEALQGPIPDNYDNLENYCTVKHELKHAKDESTCPACGSEVNAYSLDQDCYMDAILAKCSGSKDDYSVSDCQLLTIQFEESKAKVDYQKCLCKGRVKHTAQTYEEGTCQECYTNLLLALNNIIFDPSIIKYNPLDVVREMHKVYCAGNEKKT